MAEEIETWVQIIKDEAEKTSIQAVANKLGYARPSVSLAVRGKYPGDPKHIARKALKIFGQLVDCPHTGELLAQAACEAVQALPINTANQLQRRHRKACTHCLFTTPRELPHAA